ncbi:hypothetical protein BCR41DRAFT_355507 [Lobosporangium transversale]|uniref:Uncharacterized protein n=1 Tax=Lobosporangium transversale TaxID=64571 RepID=A0A1Y2GK22_9FUNG|nr:hypothetical protein BCR41DRAFT_355507 [Lobosporangium transversale]ORZ13358.1 hypothetical protein BCR41DRAFT_355507 [Lobosporangium transversale]|eukprot:XP_021880439.1 hypothetical protein BCR41DRAFT_355507 [Lobosporangium transversale]
MAFQLLLMLTLVACKSLLNENLDQAGTSNAFRSDGIAIELDLAAAASILSVERQLRESCCRGRGRNTHWLIIHRLYSNRCHC